MIIDHRIADRQPPLILAPWAGDGTEIAALIDGWRAHQDEGWRYMMTRVVAVEPDRRKFGALAKRFENSLRHQVLLGDPMTMTWEPTRGASVLYLRPPAGDGHRTLRRYTAALAPGGALLYLVPAAELETAQDWLAEWFDPVHVGLESAQNGRVTIVATRRAAAAPGTAFAHGDGSPVAVPAGDYSIALTPCGFDRIAAMQEFRPWAGIPCGQDRAVADLLGGRTFPTAMPPKPAHVALALASGHFDGRRLDPDDPASGLPPILVKGVFHREEVPAGEKHDEMGVLKARITVERPSFRMAILRLDTFDFVEPAHGAEPSGARDLGSANVRDILDAYGDGFARLMTDQFPALHDPANAAHLMRLPDLERAPLRCQAPAIMAALKLAALGKHPIFGSSVGTGKSTMSLYIWQALTARHRADTLAEIRRTGIASARLPPPVQRLLIVCPPHLVEEWEEQIHGGPRLPPIAADARVRVVKSIADLHAPADVYIMKHSVAKLGSRRRGVDRCPRCWRKSPGTAEKAARCQTVIRHPANAYARIAEDLAAALLPILPDRNGIRARITGHRMLVKLADRLAPADGSPPARLAGDGGARADRGRLAEIIGHEHVRRHTGRPSLLQEARALLLAGDSKAAARALQAVTLLAVAIGEHEAVAAELDRIVETDGARREGKFTIWEQAVEAAKALRRPHGGMSRRELCAAAFATVEDLAEWTTRPAYNLSRYRIGDRARALPGETDQDLAKDKPDRCGEYLWQWTAEPRRFPLARYIAKKLPRRYFGMMIFDEIQELNNLRSAQGMAARRLMARGAVCVGLSGSIMGGFASSLFPNFAALAPAFRAEFGWNGVGRFLDAYGFRKWIYSPKPARRGKPRGADVEWSRRDGGEATGVMPLFLLRHLLPSGIIVHQDELDMEIPPAEERLVPMRAETEMDRELLAEYFRMESALLDRIAEDMFVPGLAGKLLGALLELPSYLDRCTEDLGPFVLRYPPDANGGAIVCEGRMFPSTYRTPKERAMLDLVREERAQGRRVALFVRHVACGLPERLIRLLREEGMGRDELVYLSASAVPPEQRKTWIREKVVKAGASVLACNPNTVRTGLNDLVYLSTAWWHEMDQGGGLTFRQANGRFHRPGQTLPTRFLVPHYAGTAQELCVDHVARKVEASEQVDALSVLGSLRASGAEDGDGDDEGAGMSIGQIIYERLRAARGKV